MKFSNLFIKTSKEFSNEASIISHQLMLKAGIINQTASGIYSWLPLGEMVIAKIIKIIDEEQMKINSNKIIMPTIQPAELWKESGRYDDYGKEMLRILDRNEKEMLYGPTHEEVATDILRNYVKSYKDFPLMIYQIGWKFRDEIRPRFGVMRAREFLMKDGYSFDLSASSARETYKNVFHSYLKIFKIIGLKAIPVFASSGAIGGSLSHEFHIVSKTGESELHYEKKYSELNLDELSFDEISLLYSAADELHAPQKCSGLEVETSRGIEVGHIFYFGTKYSKSMNFSITLKGGEKIYPEMGSYGIGVSRLVGAIIESSHDNLGIIWPKNVAPFSVVIIDIGNAEESFKIYKKLIDEKIDVLLDDRDERAGVKFADNDLIGIPFQIIVGKNLREGSLEIKDRKTGIIKTIEINELSEFLKMS